MDGRACRAMSDDVGAISITDLKAFARTRLTTCPVLRQMILDEKELLKQDDFLAKTSVWLRILDHEQAATLSRSVTPAKDRPVVRK